MLIARFVRSYRTSVGVVFVVAMPSECVAEDPTQLYFAVERVHGTSTGAWLFDFGLGSGVRVPLGRA